MEADLRRSLGEDLAGRRILQRRQWKLARARRLERIAAGLKLSLDVSCLAGGAAGIFEAVEIRLELVVGGAPILQLPVLRNEVWTRALAGLAAESQVPKAPAR